jgi:peptide/nickel transport system substrate-binding protein
MAAPKDRFEALWTNPTSRRDFLRAAGIGVGALTLGNVLSGCDAGTEEVPTNEQGTSPSTLSLAMAASFTDLDPTTTLSTSVSVVSGLVYEGLYRLDPLPPRADVIPQLAVELPREITPTTFRIDLRPDVLFHDSTPFTPADLVFTFTRIKDPEVASPFARFLEVVSDITEISPTEIEVTLQTPCNLLAERLMLIRVVSEAAVAASPEALTLEPVGTGPYRVISAIQEERISLERFADYSGDRELGYENIDINIVKDANARISGLRTGQFKMIEDLPASAVGGLSNEAGVQTEAVPSYLFTFMLFHCARPPFDDARVRQAALYAIDRDTITQSSFFGHAQPAWGSVLSPEHPEYVEADTVYSYDPDRAKELLAEAGYGDAAVPIDVLIGENEYVMSQGPVIEENLRAAGFDPNMIPGAGHVATVSEGNFDIWVAFSDPSVFATDAEFILRWGYTGVTPAQFYYWQNDATVRVQELLDEALRAPDKSTRSDRLAEVQNILQEEAPYMPLHFKAQITAWSAELQGVHALPTVGFGLDGVHG